MRKLALTTLLLAGAVFALRVAPGVADSSDKPQDGKPKKTVLDNGLIIEDLAEGVGVEAENGKTISVHYTGTLENGTKFDSSRDRNELFSFRLGKGEVIRGWDLGIVGMKVGGRRKLTIPPALAYGSHGAGKAIPPNATLIFDIELFGVK